MFHGFKAVLGFLLVDKEVKKIRNNLRRDECPCCSSVNFYKVGIIRYGEPNNFSNTHVVLTEKPELWKCSECGSAFSQNIIPEKDASSLYQQGNSDSRWKSKPFNFSKTNEVIREIERAALSANRVVDVGCNTGELLDFVRGFGCETIGVELSESSRAVLSQKKHVALASLNEVEDGSVDIIFAFDLIEHLYDIASFLEKCNAKLRKTGRIILLTGNAESISARLAKSKWWYVRYCEHIVFPSIRFYSSLADYELSRVTPTFASKGYKASFIKVLINLLIRFPTNSYRGLPSLGPDHFLIELKKSDRSGKSF